MSPTACYLGIWELNDAGEPILLGVSTSTAEQARDQEQSIRVLSELSVRLQAIEHRMEVYHKQAPPAPPQ